MTVVLDTNVLIQAFGTKTPFVRLQRAILEGEITLAFSNEILLEYEEVVTRYGGPVRWSRLLSVLEMTAEIHGNLKRIEPAFRWRLIVADPDDDKFVDCAIASEAEWIVTDDAHFSVLHNAGHKPKPITLDDFVRNVLNEGRPSGGGQLP